MTSKQFFEFAKKSNAEMVDLKFTNLLGTWQHCTFPVDSWNEDTFKKGVGFDGSSIRGWQGIHISDMLALPDAGTTKIDPIFRDPTISVIANIVDLISFEDYTRDPRHVTNKGIEYIKKHGFEAPVNLAYSQSNCSAAVRIPMYSNSPKTKRFEFRCPDPSCNGYLTFTAILMAVLDGIENKLHPGDALDRDIYEMKKDELAGTPKVPASLDEALTALENDHAFMTKDGVFTDDLIQIWVDYKRENELHHLAIRSHLYEFFLYYDN